VQENYGEDIPDGVCLFELGWYTGELIATYVECNRCRRKGYYVKENREQGVIPDRQKWYGCQKRKEEKMAWPREAEA